MAGDAFDPEEDKNAEVKGFGGGPSGAPQGGQGVSYAATGGTTPTGGSPGFVNLGQMLALNKQSGADSANTLNKGVADKAASAEQGINNAYKNFTNQADAGSNKFNSTGSMQDATQALSKGQYTGPTYLGQNDSNIGQLRKDVDASQQQVNNLANPNGVAAEAGKQQSLSPTQSAASAFYMGNNNQQFNETNARFKGLSNMLTNRTNDASRYAQGYNNDFGANESLWKGRKGDLDKVAARNAADQKQADMRAALKKDDQTTRQRNQNFKGSEVTAISDEQAAARLGMSYQEWLDIGSPESSADPKYIEYLHKKRPGGI